MALELVTIANLGGSGKVILTRREQRGLAVFQTLATPGRWAGVGGQTIPVPTEPYNIPLAQARLCEQGHMSPGPPGFPLQNRLFWI